jgi:hypothetical protein
MRKLAKVDGRVDAQITRFGLIDSGRNTLAEYQAMKDYQAGRILNKEYPDDFI